MVASKAAMMVVQTAEFLFAKVRRTAVQWIGNWDVRVVDRMAAKMAVSTVAQLVLWLVARTDF